MTTAYVCLSHRVALYSLKTLKESLDQNKNTKYKVQNFSFNFRIEYFPENLCSNFSEPYLWLTGEIVGEP